MSSSHPTPAPCQWFVRLASVLDHRSALSDRFRSCYIVVAAAGERAERIGTRLLTEVVVPLAAGSGRLTLALDDTPTRRYGPYVQAAGIHHNPTPGRLAARLRPRLRRAGVAGRASAVGRDRLAAVVAAVRPQEGPAADRPKPPHRGRLDSRAAR
ncbi:MAG: hypothetical protein P4L85_15095 [Paludisphaera borealis]|uniref:hypothetical protein n=1 Tax=Paludisphaera borealis TaxID=1387353 RepID=UPI0028488A43|nr:hypothetical protein [Paludisphaera borealis]MDR3620677.1 hypothetical protein [Paludisphaera borealis]